MNLHQITDCLSRGKNIVHPVVPLAAAVTDVGGVKAGGKPALLKDTVAGLVHELAAQSRNVLAQPADALALASVELGSQSNLAATTLAKRRGRTVKATGN